MSDQSDSDTIMGDDGEDENVDEDEDEDVDVDEDEELTEPSKPIYDENDDVFRCTNCSWEVVDGLCQVCGKEHALAQVLTLFNMVLSTFSKRNACRVTRTRT